MSRLAAAIVASCFSVAMISTGHAQTGNSQIRIEYRVAKEPEKNWPQYQHYQAMIEWLQRDEVLDKLGRFLSPLRLPENQTLLLQFDAAARRSAP